MMHIQHTTTLANKRISVSALCCSSDSDHNETMYAVNPQTGVLDAQIDCRSAHYNTTKPYFDWQIAETFDSQFERNDEQASTVFQSFASCKNKPEITQLSLQVPSHVCFVNRSIPSETDHEWEQERSLPEFAPPTTDLEIETQLTLDMDSSLKRKREFNNPISSLLDDGEKVSRTETTTPEASLFHLIDRILVSQVDTETTNSSIDEGVQHPECKSAKEAGITTQRNDVDGLLDPITFETLCSNDSYWSESSCANFTSDTDSDNFGGWHDILEAHNDGPSKKDQDTAEERLNLAMKLSSLTTSSLQEWDRANGLPKSHSQTMVNSSRSREQLQSGLVLQKWNGTPLLRLPGARVKVRRRMFKGEKVVGLSPV
ncbi:hypothetical protein MHU86_17955 [Fragilaria crotonensis]|nr:hypothetical protein MHU86_17955 [Fragilaria crotonensis]